MLIQAASLEQTGTRGMMLYFSPHPPPSHVSTTHVSAPPPGWHDTLHGG